jgi:hypothetical protein
VLAAIHGVSYLLAGTFVWLNRAVPGVPVALRRAGLPLTEDELSNSVVIDDALLPWLGDVFAVPASMPLANVFSIGDIIMAAAAAYAVHRVCGTRLVRRRTTAAAAEPAAAASHSGPSPGSSW